MRARAILAGLLTAALAAGCSGPAPAPAQSPAAPGTSASATGPAPGTVDPAAVQQVPGAAVSPAELASAGIVIVADDRSAVPRDGLVFSSIQIERMLREQSLGGGVLGSDLDNIAPMPADSPPTSFILLAWLVKGTGATAEVARRAMGERMAGVTDPRGLTFPTVVVTLFVADLAAMVQAAAGQAAAGTTEQAPGLRRAAQALLPVLDAPCSTANEFIASTIAGVFDALKLDVKAGDGIFDSIIGVLAGIWNYAVELARGVVQATVAAITKPVFEALRIVATGLGAASMLMSYLDGQKLIVTVDPQFTRVALGSEPDIPGRYTARAEPLSKYWPPALNDCITAAGAKLPELMLPGATATWRIDEAPDHPGLVLPAKLETEVQSDNQAYLDFVTGREPAERATGPELSDGPIVTVAVEQKAVTDFLRKAEADLTGTLKSSILGLIPEPNIRSALSSVVSAVLDPIAARISNEINGTVGGMFTLRGQAEPIIVTFHGDPPPTTPAKPAPPSGSGAGDFCAGMLDMVHWAQGHQGMDPQPFAVEIAGRFRTLEPLAPASLRGAVGIALGWYELIASGVSARIYGAALMTNGYPEAAPQIIGYCKIPASEFTMMPGG